MSISGKEQREARRMAKWRRGKIKAALESDNPEVALEGLVDYWGREHEKLQEEQGHASGNVFGHFLAFNNALEDLRENRSRNS